MRLESSMESGGQPGNDNAKSGTEWRSSIKRALTRFASASGEKQPTYRKGIDKIADELVKAASNGDRWAIEEIGNRADGKPAQSLTVLGDEDNPVNVSGLEAVYGILAAARSEVDKGK